MGEVDKISAGIAILILAVIGISAEKLSKTKDWLGAFDKNIRISVLLYVVGLIGCEKKATSVKISKKVGYLSHDTLTRSLLKGRRVIGKLTILLINYCMSSKTTGYLIIDDVLIPKRYSKKIEGVYNEFDHVDRERTKGMKLVVLLWSDGKIRIPVAWALWHKEKKRINGVTASGNWKYHKTGECFLEINGEPLKYKTKNEIACELLDAVLSRGLKVQYVTFDSWYAGRKNLYMMRENSYHPLECYSRLKNNRKVIYRGEELSVTALARRFRITSFNHKHGAYIKAVDVYLPGYGDIKLLMVKQDSHQEPGKTKYIFSTDLSCSAPQILLRYRGRWAIETTFRDLKQNLNIGSCQATSLAAQESHIALAFFAFALLELLPPLEIGQHSAFSLGEKKTLLSSLSLYTDSSRQHYWTLDSSKYNQPLVYIDPDKVDLSFEFAYQNLSFPNCQRAA